ncbi:MAG TPA: hypothetical protein VME43_02420 [Bryobacteraceae bacterium]|nr:hypothetical protein [Bryobacteraceae bacterium]
MDGATQTRRAGALSSFLAGLQAGMLGILAMLAWLGVSAAWQQRSFWTSENLMASLFYGNRAIHSGFAASTISGLAVYLALYSLLGGLLAFAIRDRVERLRVLLFSVVFALLWYYFSYRVLWRAVAPLIALLHVERANVLGHLVYGTVLARYPLYLPHAQSEIPPPPPTPTVPPPLPPAEVPGEPAVGSESA